MADAPEDLFDSGPFFLQRLFPGESLYSWCARYHRLSGNRLARDSSLQLFGSATAGFLHDIPSHLGAFALRTRKKLGTAEQLCRQHTLLRYYIPFRSETLIQECIAAMTGKSVQHIKFRLGLPPSGIRANHPLKACAICMREDLTETGIAYWHLEHQYPSVWMCPKHGSKLMQCTSRTKTIQHMQWVLPDMVPTEAWDSFKDPSAIGLNFLQKLSQISCGAAGCDGLIMDRNVVRDCCLTIAHQRGWLLDSGRANLVVMREAFLEHSQGISCVPGLEFVQGVGAPGGGFVGTMLRTDRAHKHPVKHLVLLAFFFDSWEKLIEIATERKSQRPAQYLPNQTDQLRARLGQLVRSEGKSVSAAARQLELPLAKAMYWAQKDDLPFKRRPRKVDAAIAQKIVSGLGQGLSCEEVARLSGVTTDDVRRYRDTHDDVRAQWNSARKSVQRDAFRRDFLEVMRANPNAHQTRLRTTAGSHFDWLRKYDLEWLATQLPNLWQSS